MNRLRKFARRTFLILSFFFLGLVPGECNFWETLWSLTCLHSQPIVYFNSFGHNINQKIIHVADSGYVLAELTLCDLYIKDTVPGGPNLNDITYKAVQDVGNIIVGNNGTIYRLPQSGPGEYISNPAGIQDLYEINQNLPLANVMAVGDSGVVIKSTDHGLSWGVISSPISENLRAGEIRGNYLVVGGEGYSLYQSSDDGNTWEQIFIGDKIITEGPAYFNTIFFYNDNVGYVGGTGGYMGKTTDGGLTWNPKVAPDLDEIYDIFFISPDSGAVVGSPGIVRFTTDGGDTWEEDPDLTTSLNGLTVKKVRSFNNMIGTAVGDSGLVAYFTTDSTLLTSVEEDEIPVNNYSLSNNYPNPFNPSTKIRYTIPVTLSGVEGSLVTLKIYDMLGREIATLVDEEKSADTYEVDFNASELSSGIYYYQIKVANEFVETKKMVLIK